MSNFAYTAVNTHGERTSGTIVAASRTAAMDQLATRNLTPVSLQEQGITKTRKADSADESGQRVPQTYVEAFTRDLANLLSAGIPLSKALNILAREVRHPGARAQWSAIHDDVVGGESLADAMSKWRRSFSPVHVAMVRAGETGGFLETVLAQITEFREKERDLKSRALGAIAYPAVLAVISTGVLIFLMTYFIPRFSNIFDSFGPALPKLTLAVIAVSNIMSTYWPVILLVLVVMILLARRALNTDNGRLMFEAALLKTPGVGTVISRFALVRFCRMLGTLLEAGVPLVASLKVAREAIGNQILCDTVKNAIEQVQRGSPLAKSLMSAGGALFPPSATEMISVAEESGRLDKELTRLANSYQADLDRRLRILVTLAEPVLLFIMAGVVGTVVIGMMLPIFTLQDYIQ